jgi:hypothetical protein
MVQRADRLIQRAERLADDANPFCRWKPSDRLESEASREIAAPRIDPHDASMCSHLTRKVVVVVQQASGQEIYNTRIHNKRWWMIGEKSPCLAQKLAGVEQAIVPT